jgi:hypothetical protein
MKQHLKGLQWLQMQPVIARFLAAEFKTAPTPNSRCAYYLVLINQLSRGLRRMSRIVSSVCQFCLELFPSSRRQVPLDVSAFLINSGSFQSLQETFDSDIQLWLYFGFRSSTETLFESCFNDCIKMSSSIFASGCRVSTLGEPAFAGCPSLQSICIMLPSCFCRGDKFCPDISCLTESATNYGR